MADPKVAKVHTEANEDGFLCEITVVRIRPGYMWPPEHTGNPDPADVPADIRRALAAWLGVER